MQASITFERARPHRTPPTRNAAANGSGGSAPPAVRELRTAPRHPGSRWQLRRSHFDDAAFGVVLVAVLALLLASGFQLVDAGSNATPIEAGAPHATSAG